MIGARLLGNVVMDAICYVLCVFTWISIIDVCWSMRVVVSSRLRVVRVMNLKRFKDQLRVFDPGCLLVVRVGNLNDLKIN